VLAYAKSDIGLIRQTNEDSYACIPPNLFIVADGMGGHVAGEIASKMAVTAVSEYISKNIGGNVNPEIALEQAIIMANDLILQLSQSRDDCAGMGTTVSAVYIASDNVFWGHVGDSRIYLFRDNELSQITNDHSLVWELVQSGNITKAEAHTHPQRNMLTRAVGTSKDIQIDTGVFIWKKGDVILLCTDGLTNMLSEKEISQIVIAGAGDSKITIETLVESANKAGGSDNITAIMVKYDGN